MQQMYTPKQSHKVLVCCFTYNQNKYIEDALNGFAMQNTDFPFVCLIVDDNSIDGEQDVIKEWMDRECEMDKAECVEITFSNIILAPHKTNRNCTFAFYLLKQNLYKDNVKKLSLVAPWRECCQYEALCEGDDYWIDENKLQKQVEILDKDDSVSMVFHRAKILLEIPASPVLKCFSTENREYSATELFDSWIVPTASIVYRLSCLEYCIKNESKILNSDIFLVEQCAHTGRVVGMSDFMSVYRMQSAGVTYDTGLTNARIMKYPRHFECIAENFPKIDRHAINIRLMNSYWNRAICQKDFRNKLNDYYKGIKSVGLVYAFKPFLRLLKGRIKCFLSIGQDNI